MDNLKNDNYFVDSMVLDASFIIEHTKNVSYEAFCQNPVLMDSVCFRFIQISESGKRVSDDFKQTHKNVPWPLINGLRNRLVHTYGEVDPPNHLSNGDRGFSGFGKVIKRIERIAFKSQNGLEDSLHLKTLQNPLRFCNAPTEYRNKPWKNLDK